MRLSTSVLALGLGLLSSGCHIYFGDGDDDDDGNDVTDCWSDGAEPPIAPRYERNPYSGECEYAGGGWGGCDAPPPPDRPAAEADLAFPGQARDWAACYAGCEGQDEWSCVLSDECRATYKVYDDGVVFSECWGVAPSGPLVGECSGHDAYACSLFGNCAAAYGSDGFAYCFPEPGVCDGGGAPPPAQGLRNPETGQCLYGGGPGPCGDAGEPFDAPAHDWATCESHCTGLAESDCKAADGCRAIFWNKYPPNVDAFELVYKECWATAPSGPIRGGGCANLDAHACSRHDDCVANHDSVWFDCDSPDGCPAEIGAFLSCGGESTPPPPPPPAPACTSITDEDLCIDMADGCVTNANGSQSCGEKCAPIYEGDDCVCDPSGCECASWVFTDCVY